MSPKQCMLNVMADIIGSCDAFDGDRLNDPAVWQQFIQAVLNSAETYPDEHIRCELNTVDRQQFQEWIDDPRFWDELNLLLDQRTQLLMTLLPSENQGNC